MITRKLLEYNFIRTYKCYNISRVNGNCIFWSYRKQGNTLTYRDEALYIQIHAQGDTTFI